MTRAILVSLAAVLLSLVGFSQGQQSEFQREFDKGIAALTAGRHDEGIAAFKKCIELQPGNAVCAYNVACGYSLKKEIDTAFEWLEKSVDWGSANIDGHVEHAKKDTDLDNLRSDERFDKYIARMTEILKTVEEYVAGYETYIPEALKGAEAVPLLVVLHDIGKTKESVIGGRWKKIADQLGTAIIAPSGKHPTGAKPSEGMAWFADFNAYVQRYWTFERPATKAVSDFKKKHKLDKTRVFIAGEGQGGMVAFNVAVAAPGLYKGVVCLNAPFADPVAEQKAPNASKLGLRYHFILGQGAIWGVPPETDAAQMSTGMQQRLGSFGLKGKFEEYAPDEAKPAQIDDLLLAALKGFLPDAEEPAEAEEAEEEPADKQAEEVK